jgi:transcription antitermination factor NusG
MINKKDIVVEFAPGAFDDFEGTQEELDQLIAEIHEAFASGEALEESIPLSDEEFDELPDDVKVQLMQSLSALSEDDEAVNYEVKRNLQ